MTKVHVSLPSEAERNVQAFIDEVDERLSSEEDTCEVVTETLVDLHGDREAYERWQAGADLSPAERVRLQGYNPCNATLESEYYAEKDESKFTRSKNLQWLWRQFDATPMADNIHFALRFRQMLADHLFEECGDNCRFFKGITFTYGHNISIGDNTVVHDGVHLDDRGKLTIGDRVSLSDGVHLYSHDHDIVDQTDVRNYHTIVEDNARITYDAMVRAGIRIGANSVVGARSVVQGDVPDHHIVVGTPAKSIRVKPGWESVAAPVEDRLVNRQDEREITYDLPDGLDTFDEFGRALTPPDTPDAPNPESHD
ncbi:acetyltransferase [Halogeometricum borinquense DSM 11551]|uniref:Acetyltransferase n=1 Tax=Halogeometricum borinquense (strain ATCC 700274 / DSM 11551 / JCM 10706 / KCTC 4070 / PR3) TaxID=469382 RepID=E4NLI7_HALBP|nr:acyltransferase [Halogeometricum borinquense]ADQ66083.1 acetyltransferase (isoleucine patch superfamily) [Halogeometricum borinquense DSM 11551]ELY27421.1 acetyltransferase [Halogeometricum borinquense DSM 11551]